MVRARYLITAYRSGLLAPSDLPGEAATLILDVPGEAWTELAMASNDSWRSDLDPVVARAAAEIGYAPTDAEAESVLLLDAAYRAVTDGRVLEESCRLYQAEFEAEHDRELEMLRNAWYLVDVSVPEDLLPRIRRDLVVYLDARHGAV